MNKDKKSLLIITIILCILLFSTLFVPKIIKVWMVALLLIPFVIMTYLYVKKRSILSIYKKEVLVLMIIIALVHLMSMYLLGIHFGFTKTVYSLSFYTILNYIIPFTTVLIGFEYIRYVVLAQKNKLTTVLIFISSLCVDLLIYSNLNNINSFQKFMDIIGLTLIPALASNFLYQYISQNYGMHPNIAYRLIITLYPYIIPFVPATIDLLVSFMGLVIPLIIFAFIKMLYQKKKYVISYNKQRLNNVAYSISVLIMVFIIMLISNQFKYQFIVVGSESMTGEYDVGDGLIYERYDNQDIVEGQVIVFKKNNNIVIHRVMRIERINNINRYYTKGDANEQMDSDYILESQILGVADFSIPYIGYPSIWVRKIFN